MAGLAVTATSDRAADPVRGSLAVYPGTFDPFTPGHRDLMARALRTAADLGYEHQLASMNERLGVQTVWLPSRPQLAATSSTAARGYRSARSARPSYNPEE